MKKELIELLRGGSAHASLRKAFDGISPVNRNKIVPGLPDQKTIWELLEHLRIAQEDIIRYTFDEGWISPSFPEGYWSQKEKYNEDNWNKSLKVLFDDLNSLIKFIENTDFDLSNPIPHGEGRSYLRQVLLVADHNAYHSAQVVDIRKRLGDWK